MHVANDALPVETSTPVVSDDLTVGAWSRRSRWLAPAVASAVMLALGLWGLDRGSMWQDEAATFQVSQRTIPQILAMAHHVDVVHTAYYLAMHVWMSIGNGEVWMRIPSLLAAGVSAGLVAALGTRLVNARVGLGAGLLFAATPLVSFYAQEGRSFAIVCAAVLAGTYCLLRAGAGSRWWWVGYLVAMLLAVVLHEFAVLALVAHGVTLLVSRTRRRTWVWWGGAAVICGLAVAPIAVVSRRQSGQVSWLTRPDLSTVGDLGQAFFGTTLWVLIPVLVLVGIGIGTTLPARPGGFRLPAVAAPLLVIPPGALLVASQAQPLFQQRYVLFALAGVPLLAAAGIERVAGRTFRGKAATRVAWVAMAVIPAAAFALQLPQHQHVRSVASRNNDLAGAAAVVQRGARAGDAVIFMPPRYRAAKLAYPEAFVKVHDIALAQTPIQAADLRGVDASRGAVRIAMLARDRIWVVGRSGLRVRAGETGAVNERAVLRRHFTRAHDVRVHGMEVALYVRKR